MMKTLPSCGPSPPRSSRVLLPRVVEEVVRKTGTSVGLSVGLSVAPAVAIMSATEAATWIRLAVAPAELVVEVARRRGARFVKKVGTIGRKRVSVVEEVAAVGVSVCMSSGASVTLRSWARGVVRRQRPGNRSEQRGSSGAAEGAGGAGGVVRRGAVLGGAGLVVAGVVRNPGGTLGIGV